MYRILLADDEKMSLLSTERSFDWGRHGMEVACRTADPLQAAAWLDETRIDAAFLDTRRPGRSGLQIVHDAVARGSDTCFVLVSGFADFEYARQAISYGVIDYCTKPIDDGKTDALLERLFDRITQHHLQKDAVLADQLTDGRTMNAACRWLGLDPKAGFWGLADVFAPDALALGKPLFAVGDEATLLVGPGEAIKIAAASEPLTAEPSAPVRFNGCYCTIDHQAVIPAVLHWLRSAAVHDHGLTLCAPHVGDNMPEAFISLIEYVRSHIGEPLDLKGLAERFSFNYTYCSEMFPKYLGISFTQYLGSLRFRKACALLSTSDLSIEEIASQAGFSDARYFENSFKKRYGMTPSHFRGQERNR